jgi:hypothetical protein
VLAALAAIGGVGQSNQFECLADGTKRLEWSQLGPERLPVVALLDPVSKPEKDPSSETTGIVIMLTLVACREHVETRSGRCL